METSVSVVVAIGILLLVFVSRARSAPHEPTYVFVVEAPSQRGIGCAGPLLFFFAIVFVLALLLP